MAAGEVNAKGGSSNICLRPVILQPGVFASNDVNGLASQNVRNVRFVRMDG
jgi:hypothetical protein